MRTGTPALHKQIERSAERKSPVPVRKVETVPSGSTWLNCACSDNWRGAFALGTMANIIGDSFAGKTSLALSILTEASLLSKFKDYRLRFNNAEAADANGLLQMFGKSIRQRIELMEGGDQSATIQDFRRDIWTVLDAGEPFIYVLDSLDSLTTKETETRLDDEAAGKEEKGSYRMEKPKALSEMLGAVCRRLEKTKSLLIILSQTRDNINPRSFQPKTRSGGKALKFYASMEMWLALVQTHYRTAAGRKRIVGHKTRIKITKNKLNGKVREAEFDIFSDYGIDDVGSCVDFLVDEKFWPKSKNTISWPEQDLSGSRDHVIDVIEEAGLQERLRHAVGRAWLHIEDSIRTNRKPKYK